MKNTEHYAIKSTRASSNTSSPLERRTQESLREPSNDDGGMEHNQDLCSQDLKESRRQAFAFRKNQEFKKWKKNSKRRKHDAQMGVFTPHQSAMDLSCQIKYLMNVQGLDFTEEIMSLVESALGVFLIVREGVTFSQLIGTTTLYIKTHVKGSILKQVMDYVYEICGCDPQTESDPPWLKAMTDLSSNWSQVLNCEGFARISKLLGLCISAGLCSASSVDFSLHGVRLFNIPMEGKHATAKDLADAVVTTVTYFIEVGWRCFQLKSFSPLLHSSLEQATFEEGYQECHRCHDFAITGNLRKHCGMEENDYELLLEKTIEQVRLLHGMSKFPVEKAILSRKLTQLRSWQSSFQQSRVHGGLRIMPYAIGVFGPTSQGKTTVSNIAMVSALRSNGFDDDDERIVTLNEQDKYFSNYRAHINGIIIDDIGNTKADFAEKAPTQKVIEIVNNQPLYAVMAEAEMKGKISVEPKVVVLTSNVKDICATTYSNEPASVVRRMQVMATVRSKDEVSTDSMLDPHKVARKYPNGQPAMPDLWDITLQRGFPKKSTKVGGKDVIGWKNILWKDKEMTNISIREFVEYIKEDSKIFFNHQRSLVENAKNLGEKIEKCMGEPHDVQIGEFLRFAPIRPSAILERVAVNTMVNQLAHYRENWKYSWVTCLPVSWFMIESLQRHLRRASLDSYNERLALIRNRCLLLCTLIFFLICIFGIRCLCFITIPVYIWASGIRMHDEDLLREICQRRDGLPAALREFRDLYSQYILAGSSVLAGLYMVCKLWRVSRSIPTQSGLAPLNLDEIARRDAEESPWAHVEATPMPVSSKGKCVGKEQLLSMVTKNLCHVIVDGQKKLFACNAFFPCSNTVLIPNHMWTQSELKVEFMRHSPNVVGGNFKALLSRRFAETIPGTDLSLVWVPSGGDWKDLRDYFPTDQVRNCPIKMCYRTPDGKIEQWSAVYHPNDKVQSQVGSYVGGDYYLPIKTFKGLCMAPLVSQTKANCIVGFHLGGYTNTPKGISGLLTRQQLDDALEALKRKDGVLLGKSSGTLRTEEYDIQFFESPEIHYKSPTRFLSRGSNCSVYGSVKGRVTYKSNVTETMMSGAVKKIFGVANTWSGPSFSKGYPWQASLQYSAKPSIGMPGEHLQWAVVDYKDQLFNAFGKIDGFYDDLMPLNDIQTISGIDGKRFIDKMKVGTSAGYPLNVPKREVISFLDPALFPDLACPCTVDDKIFAVATRMEQDYVAGERAYPIFKACLKDEPTLIGKDKVRVFQGAPIAFQMLVRKYFLPCARLLSICPIASECAVGVNAQGPEWHELTRHVKRYGENRILAGDYSKYDLRMPAQVMFAAFDILLSIAKRGHYSERDILVMEGVATDICYPLMAYNGDLIQHYGSNPSGQNLTVYINSIVNSLLFRCAYYSLVGKRCSTFLPVPWRSVRIPFKNVCALITYGDDAKSSVHKAFPEFNHISVAKYLADNDMKFTMPDKESAPSLYLTDTEADFLRRKTVYNEEVQMYFGALDEDSIFKSLHSVLVSKVVSNEEQCMMNLDGALREWFSHGKEVYEARRKQANEVAKEVGIAYGCRLLDKTYDDLLCAWCKKYKPKHMPDRIRARILEESKKYPSGPS